MLPPMAGKQSPQGATDGVFPAESRKRMWAGVNTIPLPTFFMVTRRGKYVDYRFMLRSSLSSSSVVVIIRELAWKAR